MFWIVFLDVCDYFVGCDLLVFRLFGSFCWWFGLYFVGCFIWSFTGALFGISCFDICDVICYVICRFILVLIDLLFVRYL